MKKFIITSIFAAMVTAGMAQDYPDEYLGLPGDNLNLYAVMQLFQESPTLEDFERNLNDENSRINNLDLNRDNLIDYINVVDYPDGNVHTIVLRTALNKYETQDIAVFTVQRFRNGSVQIQLVGDEDLYGKDYIIEPNYDDSYAGTPNPGYMGRSGNGVNVTIIRTTPFEIAAWPIIRFMYLPGYVAWHSDWYWGYYPVYWHPWRPFFWHYYYGYQYHWYPQYYAHYRLCHQYRYARYHDYYYNGIRSHSPMVAVNVRSGYYRTTYSRPETRRDGEALYSRTYADQGSRRSAGTAVNSQRKAGVSRTVNDRSSGTVTTSSRRAPVTAGNRSETARSSGAYSGGSRRIAAPSAERSDTRQSVYQRSAGSQRNTPSAGRSESGQSSYQRSAVSQRNTPSAGRSESGQSSYQRSAVSQRNAPSSYDRPAYRASSGQRSAVSGRSSPTVSARSASRPEPAQRSSSARTPSRSSGSGNVRSSREPGSKKSSSGKSSGSRESENSRRQR